MCASFNVSAHVSTVLFWLTFCPRICCTHELMNSSRFSICMFPHYSEKETSFEKLFPPIASDLCCGPHSHNLNSEIQIQQRCLKLMGPFLEKIKSLEKKFCIKKKTQPRCSKGSWLTPWPRSISSYLPPKNTTAIFFFADLLKHNIVFA